MKDFSWIILMADNVKAIVWPSGAVCSISFTRINRWLMEFFHFVELNFIFSTFKSGLTNSYCVAIVCW